MVQSIVALIAGSIVIWSVIVRYKTINTPEFTENSRLTIGIFSAFAMGLLMLEPNKAKQTYDLLQGHWLYFFFMVSPVFLPMVFKVLQGYTFASAVNFRWFRYLWRWFIDRLMFIVMFIIFFSVSDSLSYELVHSVRGAFLWLVPALLFLCFAVFVGFVHALFGSVIAGFNIALIITHFFTTGILGFDLGTVFDLLEKIGVSSTPVKWTLMIGSTALSLHSCLTIDGLKEMVRDLVSS